MWGIIPAAGMGTRIQPLAFSKELLPITGNASAAEQRPRAVSEYLIERMVAAGVKTICFVISPGKADILNYFGSHAFSAKIFYAVQPRPAGLCDAIFQALPLIPPDEHVCIGLPDTIWFPENAIQTLPNGILSLLLFPVAHPEHFDAVLTSADDTIFEVKVKSSDPGTEWVWGALKMPGRILQQLHDLWQQQGDEYLGTVINRYLEAGGLAKGIRRGTRYVDVGTLNGYREALKILDEQSVAQAAG